MLGGMRAHVSGWLAALCAAGALASACGDDGPGAIDAGTDAGSDAAPEPPFLGPVHELSLLPPLDGLDYNHSAEVQLAVSGERVAVAFLNLRFVAADDFATDANFIRTLGVVVSTDGGASYGAATAPPFGRQTTDPNIRAAPDGTFWLGTFDFDTIAMGGKGTIARSTDAVTWTAVVSNENFGDKNWLVIDDASGDVYVGAQAGWWKIGDGDVVTRNASAGRQFVGGYFRDGVVSMTSVFAAEAVRWNGVDDPVVEPPPGPLGSGFFHTVSMPIGPTADDGEWWLRPTGDTTAAPLSLHVRSGGGDVDDIAVSPAGAITFLPAADVDAEGRLHILYYDSGGGLGRLFYIHSLTSDLTGGFTEPLVVDDTAVPAGFFPDLDSATGLRRVREYIDIEVVGSRAYLAWTHAPVAPSRVRASYVQFE